MHALYRLHYSIRFFLNGRPAELGVRKGTRQKLQGVVSLIFERLGQVLLRNRCYKTGPNKFGRICEDEKSLLSVTVYECYLGLEACVALAESFVFFRAPVEDIQRLFSDGETSKLDREFVHLVEEG